MLVVSWNCITVAQNDFDMKDNRNEAATADTTGLGEYKPGCRGGNKPAIKPSKLRFGAKGLNAIVKPIK